jgi:hypothetical protein
MSLISSAEKFVVPFEVFQALDPIERIVLREQARQGKVRIESANEKEENARGSRANKQPTDNDQPQSVIGEGHA